MMTETSGSHVIATGVVKSHVTVRDGRMKIETRNVMRVLGGHVMVIGAPGGHVTVIAVGHVTTEARVVQEETETILGSEVIGQRGVGGIDHVMMSLVSHVMRSPAILESRSSNLLLLRTPISLILWLLTLLVRSN